MYSSTIKPNQQDLVGDGKQWSGDIGAMETVVAGLLPGSRSDRRLGYHVSSNCWAICFTADWVVIVMCDGDGGMPFSYVAAKRAENIGMSVLQYVDGQGESKTLDAHLSSYLAPDGLLVMNVSKLAKDEILKEAAAADSRHKGAVHGELYSLHKNGLQMSVAVACIDRATHEAVIWKCGDIDVLYRSRINFVLQSVFDENSPPWSSKEGLSGDAQYLKCQDVAQLSMRTNGARGLQCAISESEVSDSEFQNISSDCDAAWVTWSASSAPGELIEIISQQFLHGREFTDNIRLAEENGHGFFYLGNRYLSLEELRAIFSQESWCHDTKGICFADCTMVDDDCVGFLTRLKYIRYMDLRNTAVTAKSLAHLSAFKNLKYLDLTQTAIHAGDLAGVTFPKGMRLKIDT